MASDERYGHLKAALGAELLEAVRTAKVLVVGAGGIGCELLKDLVLCGFERIETIDLDTIDVSNLNRQFLFRQKHVGLSKAMVAREAVQAFNPLSSVKAHHGNIMHEEFGLNYFQRFDLVFNALDNIGARRHVNRVCIAKKLPLIESGTTGYNGQVQPILAGDTKCYECDAHDPPKAHPICTIRSTPSKPVHCIVWAKELYKLMFGPKEQSMLYEAPELLGQTSEEDPGSAGAGEHKETTNGAADETDESGHFMHLVTPPNAVLAVKSGGPPASGEGIARYAAAFFGALFEDEVRQKIQMGIYKGAEKPPKPIERAIFTDAARDVAADGSSIPSRSQTGGWRQAVWTRAEAARELTACVAEIWSDPKTAEMVGAMQFDKDDRICMRFVAAASALRSHVFSIPVQSFHDAKGIAGNIIPAIATTNAIVAGLQVLEALKIMKEKVAARNGNRKPRSLRETNRYVWVNRSPASGNKYIVPSILEERDHDCYVCSPDGRQSVYIDIGATTLGDFVERILKARLGIIEPNIMMVDSLVYEEGDGCDTSLRKNLEKTLAELPGCTVANGGGMTVSDYRQDLDVRVLLFHKADWDEEAYPDRFFVGETLPEGTPTATTTGANGKSHEGDGEEEAGGVEVLAEGRKRSREEAGSSNGASDRVAKRKA